ncbi:MAG: aldo/keto reductase [Planctomycetes bacterium]|nr:aldo/keto reductase [Planctomycetota bacterium]
MKGISRRGFFKTAVGAAAASTAFTSASADAVEGPRIKDYRPLGRIGIKVSDISCGSYGMSEGMPLHVAQQLGVNYFDTGPGYSKGHSEVWIGEIVRKSKREELGISTRWYVKPGVTKGSLLESLDTSLSNLATDYVDVIIVGGAKSLGQVNNDTVFSAFDAAKKAGKAKGLGVASHAPAMIEIMDYAVESDKYDLIMPCYNFVKWQGLDKVIEKAAKKNIAVTVMKTKPGAKLQGGKVRELWDKKLGEMGDAALGYAALSWVVTNPSVTTAVITMKNVDMVKAYLSASGTKKLGAKQQKLLRQYADAISDDYCRPGCDLCTRGTGCTVQVQDIMRYRMYFKYYGIEKTAMEEYSGLAPDEKAAGDLTGLRSCPYGIDIAAKLKEAGELLSMA